MSFAIGLPVIVYVLLAFSAPARATRAAAALFVVTCLVMTRWFGFLWDEPSPLVKLQFSWRLLGLATLAAAAAVSVCGTFDPQRRRTMIAAFVVLVLLFHADRFGRHPRIISYQDAQRIVDETARTMTAIDERFAGTNEFDPRGSADMPPRGSQSLVSDQNGPMPHSTHGSETRFSVNRDRGAEIRIDQYQFPGWEQTIDGVRSPSANATPQGTILVRLPPGPPADVVVRYGGVPLDRQLLPVAVATPLVVWLLSGRRRGGGS
jgi:hypothetical protein